MKEKTSDIIDDIAAKGSGMTVPEGYFEDFALKMSGQLPFREELDKPLSDQRQAKSSTWLRVRPYAYMAAMFAGAWCLIKMFTLMMPSPTEIKIENYPALAHAVQHDDQFLEDYIINDISAYDIIDEYGVIDLDEDSDDEAELFNDETSSESENIYDVY